MSAFTIQGKAGAGDIRTVEEWSKRAKPKQGAKHWVEGRSAMELARAWCPPGGPVLPDEVRLLLSTSPATNEFISRIAYAEWETKLDGARGEGRNHDLIVIGQADGGSTQLGIEAKADESFGSTIQTRLSRPKPHSKVEERISALSYVVLQRGIDQEIFQLRYQLLHAVPGTLIEAERGAAQAVFGVHEFRTSKCTEHNQARNANDWNYWVKLLRQGMSPSSGRLIGPIQIPGAGKIPSTIPLYFGTAVRTVA